MTWRVARSLDQLLAQLNALAPNRSRASDGSIGDEAHQSQGSASDHNPWYGPGIVTARDYTHDPAGGLDCRRLKDALIAAGKQGETRIKYIIFEGTLYDSRALAANGFTPWRPQPSSGHYQHLHLSVMANASADDARPWSLPGLEPTEDDLTPDQAAALNQLVIDISRRDASQKPQLQRHIEFIVNTLLPEIRKRPAVQMSAEDRAAIVAEVRTGLASEIADLLADRLKS